MSSYGTGSQRWFLHLLVAWLDTRTTSLGPDGGASILDSSSSLVRVSVCYLTGLSVQLSINLPQSKFCIRSLTLH